MLRTRHVLVPLVSSVLAGCPSNPPVASLIEDGDAMPPADGPLVIDAVVDGASLNDIGFPQPFPGTLMVYSSDLVGFPITVAADQAGELVGWGVRAASGPVGAQIRMALYSNAAVMNQPAAPMAQSGAWKLADGVSPTSGFLLNAGTYWLLVSVSNTISIGQSTVSPVESTECLGALVFTAAFPNQWSSGSCFAANPINVFVRVRPSI
jgi:hypothetical protein